MVATNADEIPAQVAELPIDGVPLSCYLCKKIFKSPANLKKHMKNVHANQVINKFQSTKDTSASSLVSVSTIASHTSLEATDADQNPVQVADLPSTAVPLCCNLCKKNFKSPVNLKNHMENVHANQVIL